MIVLTESGSAANPLVIDGQGGVIDCGEHIVEWFDLGNGSWATAANLFPPVSGRTPGWYRVGDLITVMAGRLDVEGDALWSSSHNSVLIKCDINPYERWGKIIIPRDFAGIVTTGKHLIVKNHLIVNAMIYGAKSTNPVNVQYENIDVEYYGGGFSSIDKILHPRAGDGISFDGSIQDCSVSKSQMIQGFDLGIAAQMFDPNNEEHSKDITFEDNFIDRCGGGMSFACHKADGSYVLNALAKDNLMTNLGYGWSGYKDTTEVDGNSVHGRGIGIKAKDGQSIVDVTIENNIVSKFAWASVKNWRGDLTDRGTKAYGYTGDYERWLTETSH